MTPKQRAARVLFRLGYVLLDVQSTEKAVKLVMQIALPKEEHLLLSAFERLDERERKRPLGHFMHALRQRATLNTNVDSLLDRFLQHRNTLAHDLREIPGWSLLSEEGCAAADRFLSMLLAESKEVRVIFLGLLSAWKMQSEIPTTADEDAYFEELAKYEKPIISRNWGKNLITCLTADRSLRRLRACSVRVNNEEADDT